MNTQSNVAASSGSSPPPCSAFWTSAQTKPEGCERKILCWVVWPECGWPSPPEPIIGWWKHGPGCFAVDSVEHANHLVTHWAEIPEPNVSHHLSLLAFGIPPAREAESAGGMTKVPKGQGLTQSVCSDYFLIKLFFGYPQDEEIPTLIMGADIQAPQVAPSLHR